MKYTYRLENLDCAHCAAKMEEGIRKLPGVESANVNFLTQKLIINADSSVIDELMVSVKAIIAKIEPDCEVLM